jgi:hypothetical protein
MTTKMTTTTAFFPSSASWARTLLKVLTALVLLSWIGLVLAQDDDGSTSSIILVPTDTDAPAPTETIIPSPINSDAPVPTDATIPATPINSNSPVATSTTVSAPVDTGVPVPVLPPTKHFFQSSQGSFPYFQYVGGSSNSTAAGTTAPKRLIVCVHGTLRWWQECFVFSESNDIRESILIAPYFGTASLNEGGDFFWDDDDTQDYSTGEPALKKTKSTFGLLDDLITEKLNNHTTIQQVTVVGFSAGAQFVNRYSVLSPVAETLPRGASMRFIVGSASSFMFFDKRRLPTDKIQKMTSNSTGTLTENDFPTFDVKTCSGFNKYKYGFELDNDILGDVRGLLLQPNLIPRFQNRFVTFMKVLDDTDPNAWALAKGCASMAQGTHRLNRMLHYIAHLQVAMKCTNVDSFEVNGCAHQGRCVYSRDYVRDIVFGAYTPRPIDPALKSSAPLTPIYTLWGVMGAASLASLWYLFSMF